ncbi:hypothetical protein [Streptomyces sp. IB2014 016-6]|uniref:hypothetical protein n=1 Tax=Streptomyces sp. IB2014 016-6 TaxID=2517818 RepID=UPI0011CA1029|nr:hypothetical protein [Streptomyces sp. IB2014 016-6]TXL86597.1 hypothetical protein EW053_25700 [Streptomyces sp. IB2014 016-6]
MRTLPMKSVPARTVLAVCAALALGASTSTAAATPASRAPVSDPAGKYCSVELTDQQNPACFISEEDLLSYNSTTASVELVAVYNWINYERGGGYTIYSGADGACSASTSDPEYEVADLNFPYTTSNPSGIAENNTYSSVSTYTAQTCDIKLFDGADFSGASSEWIDRCTHLGGSGTGDCPSTNWYDRAGSFRLS